MIYSWLAKKMKEHGNYLSYANEEELIQAIHNEIGGKRKVIEPLLFRNLEGVPKVFFVTFLKRPENPCWVRLAENLPKEALMELALTSEVLEETN